MKSKLLLCLLLLGIVLTTANCNSKDDSPVDIPAPVIPEEPVIPDPVEEPHKEGVFNYKTFDKQKVAFGGEQKQNAEKTVQLPTDIELVQSIKMYVQFDCPCNIWDVFANVQVKDPKTQVWYEIGRYITPYGKDSSPLKRGLEFDVTDFKSVLTGTVELRIFTEVWGSDGWLVSVDLDYIYGKPDFKYSAVTPILQYNENSLKGVPYGENHAFDLEKTINVPQNAQSTHIRTIISGWGHATPNDAGGRGCAEWCFRTHQIKIDHQNAFPHVLGPIGCADNPIKAQRGNWAPDRAGWCPGMAVPTRIDVLKDPKAGKAFVFEYAFEPWTNNMQSSADNKQAFYAISNFVVVKSHTPIEKATVID
ncbi:peptide-N-glycosidase F-related protein [Flavobacterium sp. JP2137]|uniref:peptide-N-glycosidase F-related protein n=1 Tax=Flavobacterium sp. JP2137 TaxID=3414510 RepID=UPI003D300051